MQLTTIMAVCLSACQVLTDARRRPRVVQLHRVERWGHSIDKTRTVHCLLAQVVPQGFAKPNPPGPPREPAGTSSSAEALPHGLAHASGPLPRAIDTWPPETTPLLAQFHPAAPNSMQVVGGFSTLSPWITTANEQTRKVRLPNSKIVDRLLHLIWKTKKTHHRLDVAAPRSHRLFCISRPGAAWLAAVDSCLSQPRMTPSTSSPAAQLP